LQPSDNATVTVTELMSPQTASSIFFSAQAQWLVALLCLFQSRWVIYPYIRACKICDFFSQQVGLTTDLAESEEYRFVLRLSIYLIFI